jgi:hypothetical protein
MPLQANENAEASSTAAADTARSPDELPETRDDVDARAMARGYADSRQTLSPSAGARKNRCVRPH